MEKLKLTDGSRGKQQRPTFNEMISRLSIHGALDLYDSKTFLQKLTWTTVVTVAFSIALFEIYLTVNTYMDSPIQTSYTVIPSEEILFPEIYLCPMNIIDKRKLNDSLFNQVDWSKRFLGLMDRVGETNVLLQKINRNYNTIKTMTRISDSEPSDILKYFSTVSLNESDFVKECAFQRKPIECAKITRRTFDGNFGQCFLVKVAAPQKVPGFGLSLALDIRHDLYSDDFLPPFDGVIIQITKSYDAGGDPDTILLEPGGWTRISLNAIHYKLIKSKSERAKQTCVSVNETTYNVMKLDKYSVNICKQDCIQTASLKHCACILPMEVEFLKEEYRNRSCGFDKLQTCMNDFVMKMKYDEILNCSQRCLTPCNYWGYTKSTSFCPFTKSKNARFSNGVTLCPPISDTFSANHSQWDAARWCTDAIILDIGFSDLKYTEISQSISMTFDTFIGNIGGQVGLWMGVSVISIVQVLQLVLYFFLRRFEK